MKRVVLVVFSVLFLIGFFLPQPVHGESAPKDKVFIYQVPQPHIPQTSALNGEKEREKEQHLFQLREKKETLRHQAAALENPIIAADIHIQPNTGSLNIKANYTGNAVFLGTCTNTGDASAVFVEVRANFYNSSGTLLDSDFTFVQGGTNSKLTSTGSFTNALGASATGFFEVSSLAPYSQVNRVEYSFSYDTYAHTPAGATIGFSGTPSFSSSSGKTKVLGQVLNNSAAWITYFTEVSFALLNSSGKVEEVDFTFIHGSTYNYGSGNTDTALQPGETGSFSNTFLYTDYSSYSSYLAGFEWNEVIKYSNIGESAPPFGSMDLPIDGSTVSSSIAVTGWALDDTGVERVNIYLQIGSDWVYIGTASFVEGARPDIPIGFQSYPNNTKAGWGYMLLTNFLPNNGNGTFVLMAKAFDTVGNQTELGTKTIIVDNAHAVKPFGAIDTPTQGGVSAGTAFLNIGWALTPAPNTIPTNGSTLNVIVDGKTKGHPTYNLYRSDIATLFSGYNNSNGAMGTYSLNTTQYANGIHIIQWTATDNAGNSDGIGSRYFNISNSNGLQPQAATSLPNWSTIQNLPAEKGDHIKFLLGFNENEDRQMVKGDKTSVSPIQAQMGERLIIELPQLNPNTDHYEGFVMNAGTLTRLPIGSTLENNTFYWSIGPGFQGRFPLLFLKSDGNGYVSQMTIEVEVGKE